MLARAFARASTPSPAACAVACGTRPRRRRRQGSWRVVERVSAYRQKWLQTVWPRKISRCRDLKTHDFDPTCPFQLPYRCATALNMMGAPEAHGARGAPWRGWNRCPYRFRSAGSRRSGPAAHGWSSASSYNPASELSLSRQL